MTISKPTVYILQCANGQYYVGSTGNLELRLKEHFGEHPKSLSGSKFTKSFHPVKLVYTETFNTQQEAHLRERQLHKWSHSKKESLIAGDIDKLKELSRSK